MSWVVWLISRVYYLYNQKRWKPHGNEAPHLSCLKVFISRSSHNLSTATAHGWYWWQERASPHLLLPLILPPPPQTNCHIKKKMLLLNAVYFEEFEGESPTRLHACWDVSKQERVTDGLCGDRGFSILGAHCPHWSALTSPKHWTRLRGTWVQRPKELDILGVQSQWKRNNKQHH